MFTYILRLLTELSSRKSLSRIAGFLAQSELSRFLIPRFAKTYKINTGEAEKPLAHYRTLNEFFTRKLVEGARPIDEAENTLVSPVDAVITGMGEMDKGRMFNIKGQNYELDELLNHSPRKMSYLHGFYFVLYLSPTDYHRIHAPVAGTIVEKEHIEGRVYPVNDFGLRRMTRVLSRNERLITYIQHTCGELALVKVGAFNVSSIQYDQPETNHLAKGQNLAYFQFGSTVVLLTADGCFTERADLHIGDKVKMGQSLGTLHTKEIKAMPKH